MQNLCLLSCKICLTIFLLYNLVHIIYGLIKKAENTHAITNTLHTTYDNTFRLNSHLIIFFEQAKMRFIILTIRPDQHKVCQTEQQSIQESIHPNTSQLIPKQTRELDHHIWELIPIFAFWAFIHQREWTLIFSNNWRTIYSFALKIWLFRSCHTTVSVN